MEPVRAGVVGVGHLGYHHARIYNELPDVELAGVVDTDPGRGREVAGAFGTQAFESVEALCAAGVDAASVVTPTTSHRGVSLALLEAGAHVLVEKPIAPTVEDAEAMVDAAARYGRILQVGHIERFNGAVMALVDALQQPRFIECHRLSPFPGRGTDVSVVLDLMIHDLDVVLALVQAEVVSLDAIGVPVFSESEDIANVRLRFASGCVANLTSSRVSMDRMRKIRVFGDNAYVSTDYSAREVLVYRKKPGPVPPGTDPMEHITVDSLEVKKDEPLKLELGAFTDAVRNDAPPLVSGADGVRALKLAQDIVAFIQQHGPAA